jgi:hypothetical protein
MDLPKIPNKKTIKVLVTTIKEVEINFPYVTFDSFINTYYYNYKENSCIVISDNRIEHYQNINSGLDNPEVKKEEAFKMMDSTILAITEALNK